MIAALLASLIFIQLSPESLRYGVAVPFFKDTLIYLGLIYVPFAMLVMIGASNAVNLTDGLDGLAIVPVIIVATCFGLIAYLSGNIQFASYLQIHYVPGTGDLATLLGALIGLVLGFYGSMPRQPKCLWATQDHLHLVVLWGLYLSPHGTSWC